MKKYILYAIITALILLLSITYVAFGVSVGETHVVKMERMSSDSLPRLLNESSLFETSWNLCCSIRKLKTLKSGEYQIEQGISTWDLVELMRQGDQSSILIRTDETRTLEGFCESLSGSLQFKKEEYLAAICAAMGSDTSAAGMAKATSVLFANSFAFQYSDTPEEIAKRFKNMHDDYWNEERRQKSNDIGLSVHEVYVLASIVKGECRHMEEAPEIAGLYLNRLKEGMLLECDATVQFIAKRDQAQRILFDDLNVESPYNTYKVQGLPPGPIYIVEKEYIDAVLNPSVHRYLYMCAKDDGSGWHLFTDNFAVHSRNAMAYRRYMDKMNIKQ